MKKETNKLRSIIINAGLILEYGGNWRKYIKEQYDDLDKAPIRLLTTLMAVYKKTNKEFDIFIGEFIKGSLWK